MLNAAIIGLGWWGKRLVQAAEGSTLIRFARGVTLEPELARDFASEKKLAIGTSYEDVLADPAIQAVVLATPHTRHRAMIEAAAAANKHVQCEKPFALAKSNAQAAIAACRRAGVVVGVGQNFRFLPSIKAFRTLIDGGSLGTIMHAEGNYSHDWLAGQALKTGARQRTKAVPAG
jgi:predicted dehydrogenase